MGPITTEGILTSGLFAIGRVLTEPEASYFVTRWHCFADCWLQFELEQQLCLFARDEVMTWLNGRGKPWAVDISFRNSVAENIRGVVHQAETMACKIEREEVPFSTRHREKASHSVCVLGHEGTCNSSERHCYQNGNQSDIDGDGSCTTYEDV
jgi:hypothetical protein